MVASCRLSFSASSSDLFPMNLSVTCSASGRAQRASEANTIANFVIEIEGDEEAHKKLLAFSG